MNRHGNRMMLDVLDAATADSTEAKRAKVRAAIENLEAVLGALHAVVVGSGLRPAAGLWAGARAARKRGGRAKPRPHLVQ